MSDTPELRVISAAEILQPSSRFPITLWDESMPSFDGLFFEDDETAVRFKATDRPDMMGKVEVPLELPMHAAFRPEDSETTNRRASDFRIVLADREVTPDKDEACTVMPYVLFNGITSLALRVIGLGDEDLFHHDSFWLNVFEPGTSQPFSGVTDSILQVILKPNNGEPDQVVDRYLTLKQKAGHILQRILNAPEEAGLHVK